jgi:hypothetical protein
MPHFVVIPWGNIFLALSIIVGLCALAYFAGRAAKKWVDDIDD